MGKVNYIVHMNAIFESFNSDVRIKQGHITLYFAFFQKWNREFFKEKLTINSALIMDAAKIRSKTTYHNYLKDLNNWGYLHYFPSYHPSRGSIVKLPKFGTTDGTLTVQKLDNTVPKPSQNLVSSYKHKTKENLNKRPASLFNEFEVLLFFKENKWDADEGKKFFAFYKSKNRELGRGLKLENWKTAAFNFAENGFVIKEERTSPISGYLQNLRAKQKKDYGQPL
tara:strand:- start:206 stop:880 length:675 start_codon:yes stop_codon:yes gene_type:complete